MVGKTIGKNDVISTFGWLVNLILLIIPIVGLVVYIIWAFGKGNLNRRNFARATLIFLIASIILSIVFGAVVASSLQSNIMSLIGIFQGT